MEVANYKCPLNGFKSCDDNCAWYYVNHCAVLDINYSLIGIDDMLNVIIQEHESEIEKNRPESHASYRERMKAIEVAKAKGRNEKSNSVD